MSSTLMDGRSLAGRRAPALAARAAAVRSDRSRAPGLLLVAFADEAGEVAHVKGKLRRCEAAGVVVWPLIVGPDADTDSAVAAMEAATRRHAPDGVFVQVPARVDLDEAALIDAIPVAADVDIMTAPRTAAFLSGAADLAPVTIDAALLTLNAHDVEVSGRAGVVIGESSPFLEMFAHALERRGAHIAIVEPEDAGLVERVRAANLVVAAAGRPHMLSAAQLAPGTIAVDAGYYNEGGQGDIDLSSGIAHLGAVMPVPGGIGPMTVSALVERVIVFAERAQAS